MHTQKAKPEDLEFEVNVSCESVRLKQSNNEGIVTPSGISRLDSGLSKVYFIFLSKEKNPDYSLSATASWQPCTHSPAFRRGPSNPSSRTTTRSAHFLEKMRPGQAPVPDLQDSKPRQMVRVSSEGQVTVPKLPPPTVLYQASHSISRKLQAN